MNEQKIKDTRTKCERCMEDGLEPDEFCKYYGEPDGCNSPTRGEYPPDENTPNIWKIIATLEKFVEWYNEERDDLDEIADEAGKALSDLRKGILPNCTCMAEMTLEETVDYLDSRSNWTLNGQNSAILSFWLKELVVLRKIRQDDLNSANARKSLMDIELTASKAGSSIGYDVACGIIKSKASHALSSIPRNCDRFGGDKDKLIEACLNERGLLVTENFSDVFSDWLLEIVKGTEVNEKTEEQR